MPGVLIVEAMAQTAGVLVLKSMPDRAQQTGPAGGHRKRALPPAGGARRQLRMEMKVIKRKASVAKMAGVATVDGVVVAEAEVMCKLADKEEKSRRAGQRLSDADSSDRHRRPRRADRRDRRNRPLLHHRRGSRDRRPHAPDGQ